MAEKTVLGLEEVLELQQHKYANNTSEVENKNVRSNTQEARSKQEEADWIQNNIKVYNSADSGELQLVPTTSYGDIQILNSEKTSKVITRFLGF